MAIRNRTSAFAMVELSLMLDGVATARDLEEGLELLAAHIREDGDADG